MYELLVLDVGGVCVDRAGRSDPAATELVDAARERGIVVAVLSNELDEASADALPPVDHVVACNTGIQKPDRRAFQRVLLLTGTDAAAALVVDDSADNVRGAEAAGAAALHFDPDDRSASWAAVRAALGLAGHQA
ncbi:MAG: HAD-IA family hydrolase [Actinomycetota bacterium]